MLLYGRGPPAGLDGHRLGHRLRVDRLDGTVPLVLTNPPFGDGKYDHPVGSSAPRPPPPPGHRARIDPAWPAGPLPAPARPRRRARHRAARRRTGVTGLRRPGPRPRQSPRAGLRRGRQRQPADRDVLAHRHHGQDQAVFPPPRSRSRSRWPGWTTSATCVRPDGPAGSGRQRTAAVTRLVREGLRPVDPATLTVHSSQPLVAVAAGRSLRTLEPARLDPVALLARRQLIERGGIAVGGFGRPASRPVGPRGRRRRSSRFCTSTNWALWTGTRWPTTRR